MTGRFPYKHMSKYPHMLPADVTIWNAFITRYPDFFETVDYDVHVGEGIPTEQRWEENIAAMARHLTQLRIDVVGYVHNTITIVELKPRARTTAIGQVISYKLAYERQFPHQPRPHMMIITDVEAPDMRTTCDALEIQLFLV